MRNAASEAEPGLVEADISGAARALALLKVAQAIVIIVGIDAFAVVPYWLLSLVTGSSVSPLTKVPGGNGPTLQPQALPLYAFEAALLASAAASLVMSYAHLPTPASWRRDLCAFLVSIVTAGHLFYSYSSSSFDIDDYIRWAQFFGGAGSTRLVEQLSGISTAHIVLAEFCFFCALAALLGLFALWRIRAMAVASGSKLSVLDLTRSREAAERPAGQRKPIDRARARKHLLLAVGTYLGLNLVGYLAPAAVAVRFAVLVVSTAGYIFIFVHLLKARQFFQTSSESYLDTDTRPPILLLRSFTDDVQATIEGASQPGGLLNLLDYSLETRFASHFMASGPFVAVGSPQDKMPVLGAPRFRLADSDWQVFVKRMIERSALIVMVVGTTTWVNWELATILAARRSDSLVLIFPRPVFLGTKRRIRKATEAAFEQRLAMVRRAIAAEAPGSPWLRRLDGIRRPKDLFVLTFGPAGTVQAVTCSRWTKDAYDLAVRLGEHWLAASGA